MDKEIEIPKGSEIRMEDKKFSELKKGDDFYIWRYNTLIKDRVKDIQTKQSVRKLDKDKRIFIGADEVCVTLHNGSSLYLSNGKNESAMIWGTDGWHEYIILGTSKYAVKTLLQAQLIADMKILEDSMEVAFGKGADWMDQEQSEVDLEKEIDDWYNTMGIPVTADALKETARHFYELGKARKEE